MSLIHIIIILVCVLALAIGQLFFKYAAQNLALTDTSPVVLLSLATNPWFLLALLTYGGATILWVWILRHLPLTVAYPFFALSFVIVPLLSGIFLGEQVDMSYWIGVGLIIVGITVTIL